MSVSHTLKGAVGWIALDRPDAMNSLNRESVACFKERLLAWRDCANAWSEHEPKGST